MFGEIFDTFHKATKAAVQMQQEMLKPWLMAGDPSRSVVEYSVPLPVVEPPKAVPVPAVGVLPQVQGYQQEWAAVMTELFEKQRELVDAQFAYGIQVWKDAIQVALARDPEQLCKSTEVLCKNTVEGMVTLGKSQGGDYQELAEKVAGVMYKPVAAVAPAPTPARPRRRG
ncbi:MAG: hypothetical protein U0800_11715 [Isosphaeraceae bacterium]